MITIKKIMKYMKHTDRKRGRKRERVRSSFKYLYTIKIKSMTIAAADCDDDDGMCLFNYTILFYYDRHNTIRVLYYDTISSYSCA